MSMICASKRIFVTGGAGFLGSHLCERLLAAGHEVLCVDSFYTGRRANVAHLLDDPRFELMRHDITFPLYVEVDEIYNLACPASPVHYQFDLGAARGYHPREDSVRVRAEDAVTGETREDDWVLRAAVCRTC